MSADGVSLPTTLAQMGTVAKAQARGQQGAQPAVPFQEQLEKKDELKVQRVHDAKAPEHRRIETEEEGLDKRQKRRARRQRKADAAGAEAAAEDPPAGGPEEATLGARIDLRI